MASLTISAPRTAGTVTPGGGAGAAPPLFASIEAFPAASTARGEAWRTARNSSIRSAAVTSPASSEARRLESTVTATEPSVAASAAAMTLQGERPEARRAKSPASPAPGPGGRRRTALSAIPITAGSTPAVAPESAERAIVCARRPAIPPRSEPRKRERIARSARIHGGGHAITPRRRCARAAFDRPSARALPSAAGLDPCARRAPRARHGARLLASERRARAARRDLQQRARARGELVAGAPRPRGDGIDRSGRARRSPRRDTEAPPRPHGGGRRDDDRRDDRRPGRIGERDRAPPRRADDTARDRGRADGASADGQPRDRARRAGPALLEP